VNLAAPRFEVVGADVPVTWVRVGRWPPSCLDFGLA
jgi:hypothetical protein